MVVMMTLEIQKERPTATRMELETQMELLTVSTRAPWTEPGMGRSTPELHPPDKCSLLHNHDRRSLGRIPQS